MNKKAYQQPDILVVAIKQQAPLLSTSDSNHPSATFMSNPGIDDEEEE